jgi:hypothetical protein
MIGIGIGVDWFKASFNIVSNTLISFKSRVTSYGNSMFEASSCLYTYLTKLDSKNLLNKVSLLTTPNAYKESILYSAIPIPVNGQELVLNGNFADNSDWTLNAGWSISGGTLNGNGTSGNLCTQPKLIEENFYYEVTYSITNYVSGIVRILLYQNLKVSVGSSRSSNGTYTEKLILNAVTASPFNGIVIQSQSAFIGSIDNVSVKKVLVADGDMTVVRATTATRVNTVGIIENVGLNVPRLNYDDAGGCPSILLEPQRTNLALYSEQFDDVYWTKVALNTTTNSTISPNGIQNADTISANGLSAAHAIYKTFPSVSGSSYTFSSYIKANTGRYILIRIGTGQTGFDKRYGVTFDLQTGTITQTSQTIPAPTGVSNTIQNMGNGWYKISLTLIGELGNVGILTETSDIANPTFTASLDYRYTGTESYYIWGAQLEIGAYPTSYIPTIASTVTRNADVISKSGISSLIGQTEGVLFIESAALANDLTSRLLSITDGTADNRILLYYSVTSNQILLNGFLNGVAFSNIITYNLTDETQFAKIAVRYKLNDFSLWVNGINRGTITSQTLPLALSRLGFDNGIFGSAFYGKAKQVQLYKTYLTDVEMTALTTL